METIGVNHKAYGGSYRYCRGGSYGSTGSDYPAHYRSLNYPYNSSNDRRFEVGTLYQVALNSVGVAPEHNSQ